MTPTEVALVQDSFRKIVPIADQTACLFYARLFELDPVLRARFDGDMREEGRALMSLLATAVTSLDRFDKLLPIMGAFVGRLRQFGAIEEHYASVGAALIWTLQKGLGPEFTPAVGSAWTTTYSYLAGIIIEAQRQIRAA